MENLHKPVYTFDCQHLSNSSLFLMSLISKFCLTRGPSSKPPDSRMFSFVLNNHNSLFPEKRGLWPAAQGFSESSSRHLAATKLRHFSRKRTCPIKRRFLEGLIESSRKTCSASRSFPAASHLVLLSEKEQWY